MPISPLVKSGYIKLNQISHKPDKRYKTYLTEKGTIKQKEIKNFIRHIYPNYIRDVEEFYDKLKKFNFI